MTGMIELAEIINIATAFIGAVFEFVGRIFVGADATAPVAITVGAVAIYLKQRYKRLFG